MKITLADRDHWLFVAREVIKNISEERLRRIAAHEARVKNRNFVQSLLASSFCDSIDLSNAETFAYEVMSVAQSINHALTTDRGKHVGDIHLTYEEYDDMNTWYKWRQKA